MSSIGTGYDLSATTFSPDGRVFQVEYAMKAVDNSGTSVGIRCKDGVVFGVEKMVQTKLLVEGSNRRIHTVDRHVGLAVAGLVSDTKEIVSRARAEANQHRTVYQHNMPIKLVAERVASFIHLFTLHWSVRPFGAAVLIGGADEDGPSLYMIEPSGVCFRYMACAIGKAKQAAKTELEKLDLKNITCREAVKEIAKIIYSVHDDVKDKDFELELSWVNEETNGLHKAVPEDIRQEAIRVAKAALEEDMEDE